MHRDSECEAAASLLARREKKNDRCETKCIASFYASSSVPESCHSGQIKKITNSFNCCGSETVLEAPGLLSMLHCHPLLCRLNAS